MSSSESDITSSSSEETRSVTSDLSWRARRATSTKAASARGFVDSRELVTIRALLVIGGGEVGLDGGDARVSLGGEPGGAVSMGDTEGGCFPGFGVALACIKRVPWVKDFRVDGVVDTLGVFLGRLFGVSLRLDDMVGAAARRGCLEGMLLWGLVLPPL